MVSLLQGLLRQAFPTLRSVDTLRSLQSHIEIAALDRKVEARVFILDEVQRDLTQLLMSTSHTTPVITRHTSGKPFCCKYAMILCPRRLDVRIMYNISSWLFRRSASLKRYSVGSIVIVRGRADRSRQ